MEGEPQLQMARRHVREGRARVARQQEIVAELREGGYPTEIAKTLLVTLEATQRLHEEHLIRIVGVSGRPALSQS